MTRQKNQIMIQSKFICQECGAQMVLYRKRAEQRKLGQVKHMHCPSCKETRAFTEIKDWDRNVVFWQDYQEALVAEVETDELWETLWLRSSESLLHG